jgi:hypothetical protein
MPWRAIRPLMKGTTCVNEYPESTTRVQFPVDIVWFNEWALATQVGAKPWFLMDFMISSLYSVGLFKDRDKYFKKFFKN